MSEIKIECPDCQERFLVNDDLIGDPMECGACGIHFDLGKEHIVVETVRHNPRSGSKGLSSFTRSTPAIVKDEAASARAAAYHRQVDLNAVMPLGPKRLLAIAVGVLISVLVIIVFVFGGGEQGALSDVTEQKRWILAGFSALLTVMLVTFGFRKYRVVGCLIALALAAGQLAMPVLYPETLIAASLEASGEGDPDALAAAKLKEYKSEIGYATIENKIAAASSPEKVVAIAFSGAKAVHLDAVKTYLSQRHDFSGFPSEYKGRRIDGKSVDLLVYSKLNLSIEDFAQSMNVFSKSTKVLKDLRIIEVEVDLDTLSIGNVAVLRDEQHPSFFGANLMELKNIDRERQQLALQRLAKSKGMSRRSDIETQLLVLLEEKDYPHRAEVIRVLVTWAEKGSPADGIVTAQARELMKSGETIPQSTLDFCVERGLDEVVDVLVYAWKMDHVVHEQTLINAGIRAETALLPLLENLEPHLLESASNVLRKVGSEKSLFTLLTLHESSTGELKKSLKATIDEIKSRR